MAGQRGSSPAKKLVIDARKPQQLFDSVKKGLFIIGTAIVVFAAARNTITWHLQRFWGASANYWERRWQDIYSLFGENDTLIAIPGTFVVTFVVFWVFNALLLCMDVAGRPQFLLKYKIQPDVNVPINKTKLRKAVVQVLFNQLIGGLLGFIFLPLMQKRGCRFDPEDLPTFQWVLVELIAFIVVEEIMFYYSHRLLHHPRLYKYIHKVHHEWTAPIGIISVYAHPLEHILSNIMPIVLGPLIMGSHLATFWLWFVMGIVTTIISHCGYHLPLLPSPEAHDFHHLKFNNNFGVMGVLDRLHGTDQAFRASVAYKRHNMLMGLTPMREQFPDEKIYLSRKKPG